MKWFGFKRFKRQKKIKETKELVYDFDSKTNSLKCSYQKVAATNTSMFALPKKIIDVVYRKDGKVRELAKPIDEMNYPDTSDIEAIKKTIEGMKDSDLLEALGAAENNIKDKTHWMEYLLAMLPLLPVIIDIVG